MLARYRSWIGLAILCLTVLLISIDVTILGFAVPAIAEELRPTYTQLLWIVDIYGFVIASLLLTMGTLGDRVGRRRLLIWGSLLFGAASIMAAYSRVPELLILARALQGIGGATLMPSTLSMVRALFPERVQRQRAIAIWASTFAAGNAIGPILGGFLLSHFWWGSVFLINVPIVIIFIIGARVVLPEVKNSDPGRFDISGSILTVTAILLLVSFIKTVSSEQSFTMLAAGFLVLGILATVALIVWLKKTPYPLIDLSLFRNLNFNILVLVNALSMFLFIGLLFYLPQLLQLVLELDPMVAGFMLLPGLVGSVVASLLAGFIAQRFHTPYLISVGLIFCAGGCVLMAYYATSLDEWPFVCAFVLSGIGVGFIDPLTVDGILGAFSPEKAGTASAVSEVGYELGGATGAAILGSVLGVVYTSQMDAAMADQPPAFGPATRETLGGAIEYAQSLPDAQAETVITLAQNAFSNAVAVTSWTAAIIAGFAALATAVLLRKRRVPAN